MKKKFLKMTGSTRSPSRASLNAILIAWLGAFIAISALSLLAMFSHLPLLIASFGASCVLIFCLPESPLSQPRNVIGGHFLTALVGLIALNLLGNHWLSMALAVATAIALMQLTKTIHAPAGANPLIVILSGAHWDFLFTPILLGTVILTGIALIFNNLPKNRRYPTYWL